MTSPRSALFRLASQICDDVTVTRVVEPLLADMRFELAASATILQRIRIRLAYTFAWLRAVGLFALHAEGTTRVTLFPFLGVVVTTILLVTVPFWDPMSKVAPQKRPLLALLLVPQALLIALALGSCLGLVCALGKRTTAAHRTIAMASAVMYAVSMLLLQWVLPDANQAFRIAYANEVFPVTAKRPIVLLRGVGEMSLTELAIESHRAELAYGQDFARRELYGRLTLVAAPIALTGFMLTVVASVRFRRLAGFLLIVAYYVCMSYQRAWMINSPSWMLTIAWAPTMLIVISSLVVARLRRHGVAWTARI